MENTTINITAPFVTISNALAQFVLWTKTTYFTIGTISVSIFDLAVGALVIGTIIKEFIPWSDDDEAAVLWEDD